MKSGPNCFSKIVKVMVIIPKFHFFFSKKIIENLLQSKKTSPYEGMYFR